MRKRHVVGRLYLAWGIVPCIMVNSRRTATLLNIGLVVLVAAVAAVIIAR